MSTSHRGFLGSVATWECDENGHLNVRFFVAKATQGLASFAAAIGIPPGHRLEECDHHMRFLREARPAAPLAVDVRVIGLPADDAATMQVLLEIVSPESGEVHAALLARVLPVDAGGAVQRWTRSQLDAAGTHVDVLPEHAAPRGITEDPVSTLPELAEAERAGLIEISRGCIGSGDCDAAGRMEACHFIGRVADGIVNMLARLHGPEGLEARMEGRIGGAVVEYRLHYHRRPRSGDLITVRTGVRAITGRTHRLVHWLFDARSGECLCSSEAVAVTLDLQTRRAVELPEAQRRRMEAFVIAEPGG
jgi:acyl-CoA thioester hydrolase